MNLFVILFKTRNNYILGQKLNFTAKRELGKFGIYIFYIGIILKRAFVEFSLKYLYIYVHFSEHSIENVFFIQVIELYIWLRHRARVHL